MDKIKENGFALALGGIGALFLVLVYVFIVGPVWGSGGLGAQEKSLTSAQKKLAEFLDKSVLPTPAYIRNVKERTQQDEGVYRDALDRFTRRCQGFNTFFGGAENPPGVSEFTALYKDGIGRLRVGYRSRFPAIISRIDEDERQNDEKIPPEIDRMKDSELAETEAKLPLAMKQYWIAEAVVKACEELGVDGLKKIDFPERREEKPRAPERSTGSSRGEPKAAAPPFTVAHETIDAEVTVEMPYGLFEDFLARLFERNTTVPFVEPRKVEMRTLPEMPTEFAKFVRVFEFPTEVKATEAETSGATKVAEPVVEFKVTLSALSWSGVTRAAEAAAEGDGSRGGI